MSNHRGLCYIAKLAAWFALLFATSGAAAPIVHWHTPSGARVYFVHAGELPIVDVRLTVDAGSARDGGAPGLAALTNSLLGEGTKTRSAQEILTTFAQLGAQFTRRTTRDTASVSLRSLSDSARLDPAIENLRELLLDADFAAPQFARQKARLLQGVDQRLQSPQKLAEDTYYRALYGAHPYASPVAGDASLQTLEPAQVSAFYASHYTAANAVIAIVGDLNRAKAEAVAERLASGLHTGTVLPPLPAVPPAVPGPAPTSVVHSSTQTHVLMVHRGIEYGDEDYFPLYVGNHILGGSALVSRLFLEIREKRGLSYGASSYFLPMRRAGPFVAGLQTANHQADEALASLTTTLGEFFTSGPSEDELTRAKNNLIGGFPLRIDSNRKKLGYVALIGFYGLPFDYLDTFAAKVGAVTSDQIRAAFGRRLRVADMHVITVGKAKDESHGVINVPKPPKPVTP